MTDGTDRIPFEVPLVHPLSLAGRHALVAGAAAGGPGELGRALAVALAEAGATVSVTTLHDDAAEETVAHSISNECWSMGREGAVHRLDLTDAVAVEAAVAALEAQVAPIDVLVNAAQVATIKPLLEASPVFIVSQAVGRQMVGRGYGRVVNLVSVPHERGLPSASLDAAPQGAMYELTRSLGLEWAPAGVTVNALGLDFFDGVPPRGREETSQPRPQQDEALHAVLERDIPLRRLGGVQDLPGALVYLASEAAGFINAELVMVDGAIQTHA